MSSASYLCVYACLRLRLRVCIRVDASASMAVCLCTCICVFGGAQVYHECHFHRWQVVLSALLANIFVFINLNFLQSKINKWIITGDYETKESLSLEGSLDDLGASLNSLADNYLSTFILSLIHI